MIFKFLCLQKPLLKSQEFGTCYAGRGRRSGVAAHGFVNGARRGSGGKDSPNGAYRSDGPCQPAMFGRWIISVTDHANTALTKTKKCRMILRQITMSLENVTTLAGQVNTNPVRHSCRMDKSPLIFDPLGNGSPVLHIDNQKVSRLNECQEAGS